MQRLSQEGKAPCGAQIPASIEIQKLWELDVDDTIWMDPTLHEPFQENDTPRWLMDQNIRSGICAYLEVQRCKEELERLNHEHCVMWEWLTKQKHQLEDAAMSARGTTTLYLLLPPLLTFALVYLQKSRTFRYSIKFKCVRSAFPASVLHGIWM